MNYECGECENKFNSREAICEDWRIEGRSLICPSCKHYLERTEEPESELSDKHKLVIAAGWLAGLMSFLLHAGEAICYLGISWMLVGFGCLAFAQIYWLAVSSLEGTITKTRSIGASDL